MENTERKRITIAASIYISGYCSVFSANTNEELWNCVEETEQKVMLKTFKVELYFSSCVMRTFYIEAYSEESAAIKAIADTMVEMQVNKSGTCPYRLQKVEVEQVE